MDPRVRLALKLISEHDVSVPFALGQLSEWLGLSEPYLLRLFHRQLGKTLCHHLLEIRMSKAAQLLSIQGTPIKQIALECGYSDLSNFYRDFKRIHEATPKELRLRQLKAIADTSYQPSAMRALAAGKGPRFPHDCRF